MHFEFIFVYIVLMITSNLCTIMQNYVVLSKITSSPTRSHFCPFPSTFHSVGISRSSSIIQDKCNCIRGSRGIVVFNNSSGSNLGELEKFATPDFPLPSSSFQTIDPGQYSPGDPHLDAPVAIISLLTVLILGGIGVDRIFNLSLFFKKLLLQWKEQREYERRNEIIEARQRLLLQELDDDDGSGDSGTGGGA